MQASPHLSRTRLAFSDTRSPDIRPAVAPAEPAAGFAAAPAGIAARIGTAVHCFVGAASSAGPIVAAVPSAEDSHAADRGPSPMANRGPLTLQPKPHCATFAHWSLCSQLSPSAPQPETLNLCSSGITDVRSSSSQPNFNRGRLCEFAASPHPGCYCWKGSPTDPATGHCCPATADHELPLFAPVAVRDDSSR
jgi:hypothetical protein